jgi:biopolymer transport protein TolR
MAFTTRDGKTQTELSEINMIPFIDIMLVLLIIFMITAPVIQSGLEIDVPQTQVVRELAEERWVVSIDREQRVYFQNEPININALGERIAMLEPDPALRRVYFRADTNVPWGASVAVMDRLTEAQVSDIVVVTEPFDGEGP